MTLFVLSIATDARLQHAGAGDPRTWGTRVLLVQLHQEVALVRNGDMLHVWTLAELAQSVPAVGSPALPRVFRIDPVCLSSMASAQVCARHHMSVDNLPICLITSSGLVETSAPVY